MKTINLIILVMLTSALSAFAVLQLSPQPAFAAANMAPTVKYTVISVNCTNVANFSNSYTKIANVGSFQVANPDSVVEATFYGRIGVGTLTNATGAIFELRVDDLPVDVNLGWAGRANIRKDETAVSNGLPVSMSGVFKGLSAGSHTVSLWVKASNAGSGTAGRVDPGCFSSDHIVVRESLPFGSTYLPAIVN